MFTIFILYFQYILMLSLIPDRFTIDLPIRLTLFIPCFPVISPVSEWWSFPQLFPRSRFSICLWCPFFNPPFSWWNLHVVSHDSLFMSYKPSLPLHLNLSFHVWHIQSSYFESDHQPLLWWLPPSSRCTRRPRSVRSPRCCCRWQRRKKPLDAPSMRRQGPLMGGIS